MGTNKHSTNICWIWLNWEQLIATLFLGLHFWSLPAGFYLISQDFRDRTITLQPAPLLGSMEANHESPVTHSSIRWKHFFQHGPSWCPACPLSVTEQPADAMTLPWLCADRHGMLGRWRVGTVSYPSLLPYIKHAVWQRVSAQNTPVQLNLTNLIPLNIGVFMLSRKDTWSGSFQPKSQVLSSPNHIWVCALVEYLTVSRRAPLPWQILHSLTLESS